MVAWLLEDEEKSHTKKLKICPLSVATRARVWCEVRTPVTESVSHLATVKYLHVITLKYYSRRVGRVQFCIFSEIGGK